jgi:hypothetical protein
MPEKVLHIPDRVGIFPANDGQTISRRMGIEYRQRTLRQSMANVIQSPFVLVKADAVIFGVRTTDVASSQQTTRGNNGNKEIY